MSVFDEGTAAKLSAHLDLPKREKRFSLTNIFLYRSKAFSFENLEVPEREKGLYKNPYKIV